MKICEQYYDGRHLIPICISFVLTLALKILEIDMPELLSAKCKDKQTSEVKNKEKIGNVER